MNIKNKLTPRQLHIFTKTTFGHLLDVKFVFSGPLCYYILLKETEDDWDNDISIKLLCGVSFGREEFAIIRDQGIGQDTLLRSNKIKSLN